MREYISGHALLEAMKASAREAIRLIRAKKEGDPDVDVTVYSQAIRNSVFSLMIGVKTEEIQTSQCFDTIIEAITGEDRAVQRFLVHYFIEGIMSYQAVNLASEGDIVTTVKKMQVELAKQN